MKKLLLIIAALFVSCSSDDPVVGFDVKVWEWQEVNSYSRQMWPTKYLIDSYTTYAQVIHQEEGIDQDRLDEIKELYPLNEEIEWWSSTTVTIAKVHREIIIKPLY